MDKEENQVKKEENKKKEIKQDTVKKEENKPAEKKQEPSKTQNVKKESRKSEKKALSKNIWGVIVAVILVIALLIGIVCTITLQDNPTSSINGMLNALKIGDFTKVEEFVNYKEVIQNSEFLASQDIDIETQKLFFDKLEWKINEVKKDANNATAKVEITNKDYKIIISNYMKNALKIAFSGDSMTDEEMENYLIEELKNENIQTATTTINIQLEKKDGDWKVIANDELINGLMPGLQQAINSLNNTNINE